MGNFNNAEIPPNDKPVINDRIEYFIDINSTLILKWFKNKFLLSKLNFKKVIKYYLWL